jgi:hypothetical protein
VCGWTHGVEFGVTITHYCYRAGKSFFLDFSRNRPGPFLSRAGTQATENAKRTRAVKPRHSLPKKDYLSFREIWRAQRPGDSKTRRPKEKARASPSWCWPFCFPATCARVSRETGLSSVCCGLNRAAYVTLRPCACPARLRVALPSHPRSSVHAPDSP